LAEAFFMWSLLKRGLGSLACMLSASIVVSSGCSATPKGALMLSISTDMQTPKDVDVVSLFVATDGVAKFDYLGRVLPDGTLVLPSTLALVQPENPSAQVHIRVTAFQTQGTQENARVLRDVLTTVPSARTALLRLPLDFLNDGSGQGTLPAQYVPEGADDAPEGLTQFDPTTMIGSSCDPMQLCETGSANCQTMINGECGSATVNSSMLPTYTESEVFGDGGLMANGEPSSCFDVLSCFAGAVPVTNLDLATCSFPIPGGGGDALEAGTVMSSSGSDSGDGGSFGGSDGGRFASGSSSSSSGGSGSTSSSGAGSDAATCTFGSGASASGCSQTIACGAELYEADCTTAGMGSCTVNGVQTGTTYTCECGTPTAFASTNGFACVPTGPDGGIESASSGDCLETCGFSAGGSSSSGGSSGVSARRSGAETLNAPAQVTASTLNVALVTQRTGACLPSGPCYVPLPDDPSEGWTLQGGMVTLPPGVCANIKNGVTLALSSGACPAEMLSEPVCEPQSMGASGAGAEEGGAPGDANGSKTAGDATTGGSDATNAGSEGGILAGNFVGIMAGEYHTCAWDQAGDVSCWGENDYGEYGSGNSPGSTTPTAAATGVAVTAMAGGNDNTCAVTTAGAVECWGYGQYGDLGNGATAGSLTPVAVTGLSSGAVSVAMGYDVGCALTTAGAVECWGDGVLGNGTNTMSSTPVQVTGLASGIASIAAGLGHVCALTTAGALVCWGSDDGDPDGGPASVPEPVSGMSSGVAAVALGESHSCALTTVGAVSCWGSNQYGQLGNGAPLDGDASPASSPVPVPVSGLPSSIASIGGGYNHSCAVTTGGAALCWGDNANGQLGNGTTTNSSVPVPVTGLSTGVARIVGGNNYTCALTTLGGVLCWGSNDIAQFEGGFDYGNVPVNVFNP
jgi:alpha-tubulin suppressor-like RCC1 family protein